jgi:hypothetical protein
MGSSDVARCKASVKCGSLIAKDTRGNSAAIFLGVEGECSAETVRSKTETGRKAIFFHNFDSQEDIYPILLI